MQLFGVGLSAVTKDAPAGKNGEFQIVLAGLSENALVPCYNLRSIWPLPSISKILFVGTSDRICRLRFENNFQLVRHSRGEAATNMSSMRTFGLLSQDDKLRLFDFQTPGNGRNIPNTSKSVPVGNG